MFKREILHGLARDGKNRMPAGRAERTCRASAAGHKLARKIARKEARRTTCRLGSRRLGEEGGARVGPLLAERFAVRLAASVGRESPVLIGALP